MPPPLTEVRKSKDDDQSMSHRLSAFCLHKNSIIRLHGRKLLQEISMGAENQKYNLCIQNGCCQPQYLPDIRHFHDEATLDTTDDDKLNNLVKTSLECRKKFVQTLPS